jgi:Holliday junction resolvasome RuvABC DNA-binding subunit
MKAETKRLFRRTGRTLELLAIRGLRRVLVRLDHKLAAMDPANRSTNSKRAPLSIENVAIRNDVASTLVNLGFTHKQAWGVLGTMECADYETGLRGALQLLRKPRRAA